jgi:hypothetical protein
MSVGGQGLGLAPLAPVLLPRAAFDLEIGFLTGKRRGQGVKERGYEEQNAHGEIDPGLTPNVHDPAVAAAIWNASVEGGDLSRGLGNGTDPSI